MKKFAVLFMAALMMITAVSAFAESPANDLIAQINGQVFEFSSGVGAWGTEMVIGKNGEFTGSFHDGEMGETGDGYPNGTIYGCTFHGQISDPEPVDEFTWKAKIVVNADEGQVPEAIEDGIRFITSAPYGLQNANSITVFLPGTPVEHLPEGFIPWSHLNEIDPDAEEIPYFAIWNEDDKAGFISDPVYGTLEIGSLLAGGWTPAADPAVTEELRAKFEKTTEALLGVNYTPVAYLGSQVVAGTNHAILCQAAAVYPDAQPCFVILYLYEDLEGNVSLLNIADFDFGSFCTYGAE